MAARVNARLTQVELAELLGLSSPETISRYERGEREPRYSSLCKLAAALKVPVAALLPDHTAGTAHLPGGDEPISRVAEATAFTSQSMTHSTMGRSHAALLDTARRDLQRLHDLDPNAALLLLGEIVEQIDAALRRASR
jgi:DNA-binding XRE family transcriptional regulator